MVTLVGAVIMVAGGGDDVSLEGGAGIIGAGLAIWLMNVLFRVGLDNDRDRDEEDAARDFYDLHGHWPDEAPPHPGRSRSGEGATDSGAPPLGADAPKRAGADRSRLRPRRPV